MSKPEPLTPTDCDLRGLPFMQLDVSRLVDSDMFALSTGEEFKAAVALWCKSWLQIPASSLPNDDRVLAHLSGAGSRWSRIKEMALRGWVLCSDGRLYHPTVAEKARHAWESRVRQRERAAKRWDKSDRKTGNATASDSQEPRECHGISHGNAIERERERESIDSSLRSESVSASAPDEKPAVRVVGYSEPKAPKGCRLPDTWWPSDDLQQFARSNGCDPKKVAEAFCDYWRALPGARGVKLDWDATFRNWCRRDSERGGKTAPAPRERPKSILAQQADRMEAEWLERQGMGEMQR